MDRLRAIHLFSRSKPELSAKYGVTALALFGSVARDSAAMQREWGFYLDDMIAFAEKVISYSSGFDQTAFVASGHRHRIRAGCASWTNIRIRWSICVLHAAARSGGRWRYARIGIGVRSNASRTVRYDYRQKYLSHLPPTI